MEIRRLEYFVHVAELGSLGKASDVTRIAQPALTRQMRLLEEELGVVLFTRTRRGMQLTEEGEQLLDGVLGPLRQLEMVLQNVRSLSASVVGSISLGMPATTAAVLAQGLIRRTAAAEPDIQLRIVEGFARNVTEWLISGEIDVALLYAPLSDSRLVGRDLIREQLVLVGPPGSGLRADTPIDFIELMDLPLIIPHPRNGIRSIIERVSARHNKTLTPKCIIDSLHVTKQLVATGEGYSLLPLSAVRKEVSAGLLTYAPIDSPYVARQLMYARRRDTRMPRIVNIVQALVQQEIVALNEAGDWPGELLLDTPHG